MRITAYITTSGDRTLTRMPYMGFDTMDDVSTDGAFDEAKAIAALKGCDMLTFSSSDGRAEYAFACQFLVTMHRILLQTAAMPGCSGTPECRHDRTCARRMASEGRRAYVRADIAAANGALRVRVNVSNRNGAVGWTDVKIREVAVLFAHACLSIERGCGRARFAFVEGDGADGVFARAREIVRANALAAKRVDCPNRRGDYCSPICPTCELYANGRCAKPVEGGE